MRPLLATAALAALVALAPAARAQSAFMPYLGLNFEGSTPTAGVAARFAPPLFPVAFQPGVEVTLDDGTNVQVDGNLVLSFPGIMVSPYVGAGVAVLIPDGGDADVGANGLAGAVLNVGFVRPFAQVRVTTDFEDAFFSGHVGVSLSL